jgi:pyruvate formate lyase activating enzyme
MTNGLIFDIKRYAINDGPGIRLTVFFKGCPLACTWCHNPESISPKVQKMYSIKRCIGARACIDACPNNALSLTPQGIVTDTDACRLCGKCAKACPTHAIEMSGEAIDIDAIMQAIENESLFFDQSEGGVTFSGGEPLLHHGALKILLQRCAALYIHRVVDTALYAQPDVVKEIARHTDLFLVDLKLMDSAKHQTYTGVPNELILQNIEILAVMDADFVIRVPLIQGINADYENIEASAAFLASLPWQRKQVNLLPYHDIAQSKHKRLGTDHDSEGMSEPSQDKLDEVVAIFKHHGLLATVGG